MPPSALFVMHRSQFRGVLTASPPPPEVVSNALFFDVPLPTIAVGSGTAPVTAGLVDCGLAAEGTGPCANATGRVCLIQRGGNTFCSKANACVQGGGVGVIIFNRDDLPLCAQVQPTLVVRTQLLG